MSSLDIKLERAGRSLAVLAAVDSLTQQTGYSPSVREVGKVAGVSSSSTAHDHLQRLQELGLVAFCPKMARTLRLTEAGRQALSGEGDNGYQDRVG